MNKLIFCNYFKFFQLLILIVVYTYFTTSTVFAQEKSQLPELILATTGGAGIRARTVGGLEPEQDPGYYVEAARKAASFCGTSLKMKFMPWPRVLKAVKVGAVSAGFASSFKPERAEYGAYPMKDGQPNVALAQRSYSYSLYAHKEDAQALEDWESLIDGASVGVERSSSIISVIEDMGGEIYPQTNYDSQLNLLMNKRFRFTAGITDNFDRYIEINPNYRKTIVKLSPPLQKKAGYVMFSKKFYNKNRKLVECFWQEAARLTKTPWYEERKNYYLSKYN